VIVLIDTTTLASMAIALPGGTLAIILDAWRQGRFVVVISDPLMLELRRTLGNDYFRRRLSPEDVRIYLDFVQVAAMFTSLTVQVSSVATHPEDDLVLSAALSGRANYLVTSDRRFRTRVPRYQNVALRSPAEFVTVLADLT
jgi:putative PIN family toxin of toxin-antitoxin system